MDNKLLKKLNTYNRKRQPRQIIETLEALPEESRDYDAVMHLARAYNNRLEDGDFDRAITLLQSVANTGQADPLWHYRLGYAYFYTGRYSLALPAFEAYLAHEPGDHDAKYFAKTCRKRLAQDPVQAGQPAKEETDDEP